MLKRKTKRGTKTEGTTRKKREEEREWREGVRSDTALSINPQRCSAWDDKWFLWVPFPQFPLFVSFASQSCPPALWFSASQRETPLAHPAKRVRSHSTSIHPVSHGNCCGTVNVTVVQQFIHLPHVLSLFLIVLSVSMVAVLGKKQLLW